ncbi:hypothetical protein [Terasakiella pusilla]|uniref:hypothetical protein n=1 Tax=Terasakiella pusilla TaxID=64973 RepID=UPI003AA7D940
MTDEGNPITRWEETVKRATDAASSFANDLHSQLDAIRVAGEKELDEFGAHNKLVCDENDNLRNQIETQAAEIERLRKSLTEMITAIQDGQIDSPELGGGDVPVHRWHEEWLHHAQQALKGGA